MLIIITITTVVLTSLTFMFSIVYSSVEITCWVNTTRVGLMRFWKFNNSWFGVTLVWIQIIIIKLLFTYLRNYPFIWNLLMMWIFTPHNWGILRLLQVRLMLLKDAFHVFPNDIVILLIGNWRIIMNMKKRSPARVD